MIYLDLFLTYCLIGLFTIGGGYAMLPLIKTQMVDVKGWIDLETFTDIVGISQMTPGPVGINCATYIGYTVIEKTGASAFECVLGSLTATFAVVLPSFIIVLLLCMAYEKIKNSKTFTGVMTWLRPAVIGLIASAAALLMTPGNFPDWKAVVICILAFAVSMTDKVNPILMLLASAVVGIIIY